MAQEKTLQLPRYMGIETIISLNGSASLLLQLPRYMGIETMREVSLRKDMDIATSSLYGD